MVNQEVSTAIYGGDDVADGDSADSEAPTTTQVNTTVPGATPTAGVVSFFDAPNIGNVDAMAAVWRSGDRGYFTLLAEGTRERAVVGCAPAIESDLGTVICQESVGSDFYDPVGE